MQSNNYFTTVGNLVCGCFLFHIELLHCCCPMILCDLFYGFFCVTFGFTSYRYCRPVYSHTEQ